MSNNNNMYLGMLLLLGLVFPNLQITGAQPIGLCYGMLANNLPPPEEVVNLYKCLGIKRMRIYDPNPAVLHALRCSNIELVVGIPNDDLQSIAENQSKADEWVRANIINFSDVKFTHITVGNEVDPTRINTAKYVQFLFPAMQNIQNALDATSAQQMAVSVSVSQIKVTTTTHSGVLGRSFPPSEATFSDEARPHMESLLKILTASGSPLFVSVYPYFSYIADTQISLDFALFNSTEVVVTDGSLQYKNLFDASLDAFYSAVEKVGYRIEKNAAEQGVHIVVDETGWPTKSRRRRPPTRASKAAMVGSTRASKAATVENANKYINNLKKHLYSKVGTPKRPGEAIEVYLFATYDENLKEPQPGLDHVNLNKGEELYLPKTIDDTTERHFGLYTLPDQKPKYPFSLT